MHASSRQFSVIALLAVLSTGVVGCDDDIDGTLTVDQPLTLKVLKDKKITAYSVPVGSREMKLDLDHDDGLQVVKIEVKEASGKKVQAKLVIPADQAIPERNGEYVIAGADVGQDFDIQGSLRTDESDSPSVRTQQSCSRRVLERVCRDEIVVRPNGRRDRIRTCSDQYVTRYGSQEAIYHTHTTHAALSADFVVAGSNERIGSFTGSRTDSRRVDEYVGPCYLSGGSCGGYRGCY